MLTRKELDDLVVPDEELAALLKDNPFPKVPWDDFPALRRASSDGAAELERLFASASTPSDLVESNIILRLRDSHPSILRVVRPASGPPGPLILVFHGGGMCMGNSIQYVGPARGLAKLYGATVVSISYRLAPEHPWPQSHLDGADSIKWCGENAAGDQLRADLSRGYVLGGSSAGGNLAAVLAQQALDEGWAPRFTAVYANIPYLLHKEALPERYRADWISRTQDGPRESICLCNEDIEMVLTKWKPDTKSALFSPFNAKTPFKGQARTFVQVCGGDPLRDDGIIYEDALKRAGTETKLMIYPGLPHSYFTFFPELKATRKFRVEQMRGFAWLLGVKPESDQRIGEVVDEYIPKTFWD